MKTGRAFPPITLSSAWLHPLLLALWPILFLYAESMESVPWTHILRPAAVSVSIILLLLLALRLRVRHFPHWALLLSFLIIWFHSYGYVRSFTLWRNWLLLPVYFVLLVLGLWGWKRLRGSVQALTQGANVAALALVLLTLLRIFSYHLTLKPADGRRPSALASAPSALPLGYRPDIYYLILDSYTRSDILRQQYGVDNSAFLSALKRRGFYVASQSFANYAWTKYSIPSALEMDYIHKGSVRHIASLLSQNRVCDFLQAQGYAIVSFPTSWEAISFFPADYRLSPSRASLTPFEVGLLNYGFRIRIDPTSAAVRKSTLFTLKYLPRVRELVPDQRPLFIFAHLMPPHPPFVFGPQGEDVSRQYAEAESALPLFARAYAAQVQFISRQMLKVIDEILAHSPQPPVIIVQGDHGARAEYKCSQQRAWPDLFPILNAYYLPDGGEKLLWESITPVNSFRIVFRHCFGASYEKLADLCYDLSATPSGMALEFSRLEPATP